MLEASIQAKLRQIPYSETLLRTTVNDTALYLKLQADLCVINNPHVFISDSQVLANATQGGSMCDRGARLSRSPFGGLPKDNGYTTLLRYRNHVERRRLAEASDLPR